MTYKWQPKDDLIALLLYRSGASTELIKKSAKEIGCPWGSLKKRIENMAYLDGIGKMSHASDQTKDIFKRINPLI